MKGYIDEDKENELDRDEIKRMMNPRDGIYEVDLEYNDMEYHITIQERDFKEARGNFLDRFDGVIYMFSCTSTPSFLSLREFFLRQVAAESEMKPRVVIGNKLDLVPNSQIRDSVASDRTMNYQTNNGGVNLIASRAWVNERMLCDYAEVCSKDASNVDEVFCIICDIIEQNRRTRNILKDPTKVFLATLAKMIEGETFVKICLGFVSLFGLIDIGAGFYSGARLAEPTGQNWVFFILLFLGLYNFIIGIIGFYGTKHRSREYLKTVLGLLIPLTIGYLVFIIILFVFTEDPEAIGIEYSLSTVAIRFISIFNIFGLIFKTCAIVLLALDIKRLDKSEVHHEHLSKSNSKNQMYNGLEKSFRPERPRKSTNEPLLQSNI